MKLLTKEVLKKLEKNNTVPEMDRKPVVKFFGGGACTWLISEKDGDTLFGLCDLGCGTPEMGYVSFAELAAAKFPPFGLKVERDLYFTADKTLVEYADEASEKGFINA